MADAYKLQYDGMTLTYPGLNGYVGYEEPEPLYKTRYEKTLFETSDGVGINSGTYSDSFANYDEIGLLLGYGSRKDNGRQWVWFDSNSLTGNTGSKYLNYTYGDKEGTTFVIEIVRFNWNNTNKNFTVNYPNSYGFQFYTNKTDNTTLKSNYDSNKAKCITKIVGVKYQ